MAAENSDGSLIIDTELDNNGFEKGVDKLLNAVKELTQAVDTLGDNLMRSFGQMAPMLQAVASATSAINERMGATATQTAAANERIVDTEERVTGAAQEAANAVNQQSVAANTTRTSISSLEKEVNSLSSGLQAVSQSAEGGFANGKAVLAFDNKITALEQRLTEARQRLADFGNTQIPTEAFKEISAQVEKAEQSLFKLYERRDTFEALGVKENSKQWQRLTLDIKNAETILSQYERQRDSLAANGGAFISGNETAEFARMQEALNNAGTVLERNKSLVDQEALAQARLNVLTAQEAVAAATTTAEREAALQRLQTAQAELNELAASMSNNPGAQPPAPDEEKITLWQRLGAAIKTAGSAAMKATATLAKVPFQAMAKGVKALGAGLKNFIGHAKRAKTQSNALVKTLTSLKRMLITRIKRMFISSIFNSAKESLQTLAKFSDSFNNAMSNIKNSSKELSANLAVSMGRLIEKIEPIITRLIDSLSKAITYINAFFALLSGKQTMTVAKKQTDSYRDSLDGAAKSAEELKNQVYGFDELNKRSDNDKDSGGANDGSDLFEEVPIDSVLPDKLKDLFEELKKLWEDADFFNFGKKLAEGLNMLMQEADDWINNKFRPKGVEWAKNIAEILNGLVDGFDWELMGKTLADGLNSVFDIINTFLTTFDFEALGKGIGKAINGWFDNVEWDLLGQTFANGWNALVDFIFGIVSEVDWANVGDSIAEFIQNFFDTIDWDKTAQTIITAINGIVEAFDHLFTGVDWNGIGQNIGKFLSDSLSGIDWGALFQTVIDGVNSIFELILGVLEGFDWGEVARSLAEGVNKIDIAEMLTNAARIVSEFVTGVLEFAVNFIETVDWHELISKLWDGLVSIVNSIDFEKLVELAFELLGAAIGAATQIIFTQCEKIWELFKEAWEGIKSYFSEYIEAYGGDIIAGLFMGIVNALVNIGQWIYDHIFKPFIDGFKKAFGINSPSTVMAEMGKYIVEGLLQGIKNVWNSITQFFTTALNTIKQAITTAWNAVKQATTQAWEAIKNGIKEKFDAVKTTITNTANAIKTTLTNAWNAIKQTATQAWENIKSGIKQKFDAAKQAITSTADAIKNGLTNAWNNIKSSATTVWENIKSTISQKWEALKNGLNTATQNMNTAITNGWNALKQTASSSWDSITSTVSNLWNSLKNTLSNTNWRDVGTNLVNGIQSGITSAWTWLSSTVSSLASGLVSGVKSLLGIHSPSKVFAEIGKYIDLGLTEGIEKHERAVLESVSGMAQDVTDQFDAEKATLQIDAEGTGLVDKLAGITTKLSDIANVFREINAVLANMGGLQVPAIATGTEVPYKTRVSSDTPQDTPQGTTSGMLDERLSDFTFLLRQILDLLERKNLGVDNDELAAAIAFALTGAQRGFGGT
jgi:phage-related protein